MNSIVTLKPRELYPEAIQFNGQNTNEIKKFAGKNFLKEVRDDVLMILVGDNETNPGVEQLMLASDWILRKQVLNRIDEPVFVYFVMNDKKMRFYYDIKLDLIN